MQDLHSLLKNLKIYTAPMSYKELDAMDVTVHGQDEQGSIFAPTWRMVHLRHEGKWDEREFSEAYNELIINRLKEDMTPLLYLANLDHITFTCFCGSGEFCHRYILAEILKLFGATYKGER